MDSQRAKGQRPLPPAVTAWKGKTQHLSHTDTAWKSRLFLAQGLSLTDSLDIRSVPVLLIWGSQLLICTRDHKG